MAETLEGLNVDPQAMRSNLDSLRGLPMTEFVALDLAADLGKTEAHAAVEAAALAALKDSVPLADALVGDPRVAAVRSPAAIQAMVAPERAEGSAQAIIDRALSRWSERDQNG
jgi:3-carboxy-cis,cis-muconate cycloisomerase